MVCVCFGVNLLLIENTDSDRWKRCRKTYKNCPVETSTFQLNHRHEMRQRTLNFMIELNY